MRGSPVLPRFALVRHGAAVELIARSLDSGSEAEFVQKCRLLLQQGTYQASVFHFRIYRVYWRTGAVPRQGVAAGDAPAAHCDLLPVSDYSQATELAAAHRHTGAVLFEDVCALTPG